MGEQVHRPALEAHEDAVRVFDNLIGDFIQIRLLAPVIVKALQDHRPPADSGPGLRRLRKPHRLQHVPRLREVLRRLPDQLLCLGGVVRRGEGRLEDGVILRVVIIDKVIKYALKRAAAGLATILIVSFLTFAAFSLISGDTATAMLGTSATPERVRAPSNRRRPADQTPRGMDTAVIRTKLIRLSHRVSPTFGARSSRTGLFFAAAALSIPRIAMTVRMLRSTVQEELGKDYVRTAISRGNDRAPPRRPGSPQWPGPPDSPGPR